MSSEFWGRRGRTRKGNAPAECVAPRAVVVLVLIQERDALWVFDPVPVLCCAGFVCSATKARTQRESPIWKRVTHMDVVFSLLGPLPHSRAFNQAPRCMLSTMRIDVSIPVADDTRPPAPTLPLRTTPPAPPQVAAKHQV